jgi:antitoxin component YwqK of YwqJK toxin-antitoxin module
MNTVALYRLACSLPSLAVLFSSPVISSGSIPPPDCKLINSPFAVGDTALREVTHYYKSGQLLERYWLRNGLLEGSRTVYHRNGRPNQEMGYRLGQLDGAFKRYNKRGQLEKQAAYANGSFHGAWAVYEHGAKRIEASFAHGKLNGWYYEYYRTGVVQVKCFYRAGGIVSGEQHYRADGTLAYEYISNKDHNRLVTKAIYDQAGHRQKLETVELMPLTFYLFGAQAHE